MLSREAYQQKLSAQLDQWRAKIDLLDARAKEASADARIACEDQVKELKAKQEAAESKLQELRESSGDAWDELKSGVDDAWERMARSVDEATSKFKH